MRVDRSAAVAVALGISLGSGAGLAALSTADNSALGAVRVQPAMAQEGASEAPFDIELDPAAVTASAKGREKLRFDVKIRNKYGKAASFKYAGQIVDDRGNPVSAPISSEARTLKAAEHAASGNLETPEELADGFYQIRITAVGSDGENSVAQVLEQPIQVVKGRVTPISEADWFTKSNANQAQAK